MSKRVVVVAAHADDEVLGCGGTLARHGAEGDYVHAIYLADGESSRKDADADKLFSRRKAAERARAILGIQSADYFDFPDNRMDGVTLLDIVQKLEAALMQLRPDIIYTHHYGDLNVDHRVTHQAVMTSCRPQPGSSVKEIYAFEVVSSTEWAARTERPFLPVHFVDIGPFLISKLSALEAYGKEMREPPHSRSLVHIEALARHRGCSVGLGAAEAFMALRSIR